MFIKIIFRQSVREVSHTVYTNDIFSNSWDINNTMEKGRQTWVQKSHPPECTSDDTDLFPKFSC